MARLKRSTQEVSPEIVVDHADLKRQFVALARRLRLTLPLDSPEYQRVEARIAALSKRSDDPAERLGHLLDLADEMRVRA